MTWLDSFVQDLRYGARQLMRSPGFAAVAVLSLALGIGANTAIFQLVDAVRLRTLPVKDPQDLVYINFAPIVPVRVGGRRGALFSPIPTGSRFSLSSRHSPVCSPGALHASI